MTPFKTPPSAKICLIQISIFSLPGALISWPPWALVDSQAGSNGQAFPALGQVRFGYCKDILGRVLGICIKYQVNRVLSGIEILIGYSQSISLREAII